MKRCRTENGQSGLNIMTYKHKFFWCYVKKNGSDGEDDLWARVPKSMLSRIAWRAFKSLAPKQSSSIRLGITVLSLWVKSWSSEQDAQKRRASRGITFELEKFRSQNLNGNLSESDKLLLQLCEALQLQAETQITGADKYTAAVFTAASKLGAIRLRDLKGDASGLQDIYNYAVLFSVIQLQRLELRERALKELTTIIRAIDPDVPDVTIGKAKKPSFPEMESVTLTRLFLYIACAQLSKGDDVLLNLRKTERQFRILNNLIRARRFLKSLSPFVEIRTIALVAHLETLISIYVQDTEIDSESIEQVARDRVDQYADLLTKLQKFSRLEAVTPEIHNRIHRLKVAGDGYETGETHRKRMRFETLEILEKLHKSQERPEFWGLDSEISLVLRISKTFGELSDCLEILEAHIRVAHKAMAWETRWSERSRLATKIYLYGNLCSFLYLKDGFIERAIRVRVEMDRNAGMFDAQLGFKRKNFGPSVNWAILNAQLLSLSQILNQKVPLSRLASKADRISHLNEALGDVSRTSPKTDVSSVSSWHQISEENRITDGVDAAVIISVSDEGTSVIVIPAHRPAIDYGKALLVPDLTTTKWIESLSGLERAIEASTDPHAAETSGTAGGSLSEMIALHRKLIWDGLMRHVDRALRQADIAGNHRVRFFCPGFINLVPIHCAGKSYPDGTSHSFFDDWVSSYSDLDRKFTETGEKRAKRLLIVEGETGDLPSLEIAEKSWAEVVRSTPGARPDAVIKHLRNVDYAIFYAHGIVDPSNPLASGIALGKDQRLSAADLVNVGLSGRPGILLASCRLGMSGSHGHTGATDGIVRQFLRAGAASVISSSWPLSSHLGESLATILGHNMNHKVRSDAVKLSAIQRQLARDQSIWSDLPPEERLGWISLMCFE